MTSCITYNCQTSTFRNVRQSIGSHFLHLPSAENIPHEIMAGMFKMNALAVIGYAGYQFRFSIESRGVDRGK